MLLVTIAFVACMPSVVVGSSWNADTGIYGTHDHFGNPPNGPATFLCGVGYDLRYRGALPLESVDVAVRYPPAFLARVGDQPYTHGDADGWVADHAPIAYAVSAGESPRVPDPAKLGHMSGTAGTICPGGASDLDAMRGTLLRIRWLDGGVGHEEQFVIDRIRGNVKVFAGDLSGDGLPRLEWER